MKPYNYILFDWDGCMSQTLDITLRAYKAIFKKYSLNPTDEQIIEKVFGDWNGPIKVGLPQEDIDSYTKEFLEKVNETYAQVSLYDGVLTVVNTLRDRNKKLALITTTNKETVFPALKNSGVMPYFEAILCKEDVKHSKPDPEIVNKAITRLNGTRDETVIIGDSDKDLRAAQNAGIDSVLFFPEQNEKYYKLEELQKYNPTYIIRSFEELLQIIT